MTQLFISYARENRDTAERLASALGALGVDVWWDRELPGGSEFSEVIEQQLGEARVVIVLWSELSVRSSFVRDESMRALEAGKLLPVRIEPVVPPLGFGQIHALDLLDWGGAADDPAFIDVANELRKRLGQPTAPRPALRLPWPRWQRQAVIGATAVLLVALVGFFGWNAWNVSESRRNLGLGLEEHFGPEPNLQAARNHYLDALEHLPSNARARYYLGHVYAQLGEPDAGARRVRARGTRPRAPRRGSVRRRDRARELACAGERADRGGTRGGDAAAPGRSRQGRRFAAEGCRAWIPTTLGAAADDRHHRHRGAAAGRTHSTVAAGTGCARPRRQTGRTDVQ